MIKLTRAVLGFNDYNSRWESLERIWAFDEVKTFGSEAKFLLSGVTLRRIQALIDSCGNPVYDPINRLIGSFPYQIDTKLEDNVIIFEEKIKDVTNGFADQINRLKSKDDWKNWQKL